ncbi:MAG: ATP-grasp domain-containing protein [Deltaproteobacteria bacterium]|nr:MAG: ATP-grasp domain-containing protein [Deltaproteobacteria bacterium]
MPNVLLTSAGRRVALLRAFRAALASVGGGRVLAADAGGTAAAIHEADEGFVVPRCDSPDYVPALLAICRRESVALVVPTIDPELPVLGRAREAFAREGVLLAASGPATNDIAFDKANTAAFFDREGIPAPRRIDLGGALAGRNGFAFPVALKPRFGSGSVGVHIVRDLDELHFYARRAPEPLLQEYVEGIEFTLDVLVGPDGSVACVVPRRRLETRAGEISKGYTVRDAEIEAWGRRVCGRLPDAAGPITLQCFRRRDGHLAFIEINPRFGGGFPLSLHAGADYPRWLLEWALGLPSTASPNAWRADVAMLRYDDAIFVSREELS